MNGVMSAQPKLQLVNELEYSDSEDSNESCEHRGKEWEAAQANEDRIGSTIGFLIGDEDLAVIREAASEDSLSDESEIDEVMVGREIDEAVERAKKHVVLDELLEKMCSPEKGEPFVDTPAMVVTPPKQPMPESILRKPCYYSPTLSLPDLDDEQPFDHPMKQVPSRTESFESQNDTSTLEADDEYEELRSNQAWDEDDSSFSSSGSPFFGYVEEKSNLLERVDMLMDKIAGAALMDDETIFSYKSDSSANNQLFCADSHRSIDILTDELLDDASWHGEESRQDVPDVVFMAEPLLSKEHML